MSESHLIYEIYERIEMKSATQIKAEYDKFNRKREVGAAKTRKRIKHLERRIELLEIELEEKNQIIIALTRHRE